MKEKHDTSDSAVATVFGAAYSLLSNLKEHINFWEIGQAVLCSVLCYAAIRCVRFFFPEKKDA